MKYLSPFFLLLVFSLTIISCSDNPSNSEEPANNANPGTLVYGVKEYDNIAQHQPKVQVTYKNIDNDLVVDTVQVPWEKSFDYTYSNNPESLKDFDANLIVQYKGEDDVALIAKIEANNVADGSGIGNSFVINLKNEFKIQE